MTDLPQLHQDDRNVLTTPFSVPWLRSLRRALGSINGRPVLMAGFSVSQDQRAAIRREIARLTSWLSPGPGDHRDKAVALAQILAAFSVQAQSAAPARERMEAYFAALGGVPAWAVDSARRRIMEGRTEMRAFAPTPPELAAMCREDVARVESEVTDLQRILDAKTGIPDREPGERTRVEDGFKRLRGDLVIERAAPQ
jgi:hypothetical protein